MKEFRAVLWEIVQNVQVSFQIHLAINMCKTLTISVYCLMRLNLESTDIPCQFQNKIRNTLGGIGTYLKDQKGHQTQNEFARNCNSPQRETNLAKNPKEVCDCPFVMYTFCLQKRSLNFTWKACAQHRSSTQRYSLTS